MNIQCAWNSLGISLPSYGSISRNRWLTGRGLGWISGAHAVWYNWFDVASWAIALAYRLTLGMFHSLCP
jgi:hypothetical protein